MWFVFGRNKPHKNAACELVPTSATAARANPCPPYSNLQTIEVNAVHHSPARPWLLSVGGDDCLARVYDMRTAMSSDLSELARPAPVRRMWLVARQQQVRIHVQTLSLRATAFGSMHSWKARVLDGVYLLQLSHVSHVP
jgi:hypothetical protein